MVADVTPMFPRARDPHVFPASVSQYSVIIPKDAGSGAGRCGSFPSRCARRRRPETKDPVSRGPFLRAGGDRKARTAIQRRRATARRRRLSHMAAGPGRVDFPHGRFRHRRGRAGRSRARARRRRRTHPQSGSCRRGGSARRCGRGNAPGGGGRGPEPAGEPDGDLLGQGEPVQGALSADAAAFRLSRLRGRPPRLPKAALRHPSHGRLSKRRSARPSLSGRYELTGGERRHRRARSAEAGRMTGAGLPNGFSPQTGRPDLIRAAL